MDTTSENHCTQFIPRAVNFSTNATTLGSQSHILFPVCNNWIDSDAHVKVFTNIAEANMITNDAQHKQIFGTTL